MKQQAKQLLFRLLGKHPHAVVVSFATGPEEKIRGMVDEVRRLLPDRRHFLAGLEPLPLIEGVTPVSLDAGGTLSLLAQLFRALRRCRIGMAPVLLGPSSPLRRAAFLFSPTRILAYNGNLERHHLRIRTAIASWLFWRGVPLDRIWLRPRWLGWLTHDHSSIPDDPQALEGRPPHPRRRRIGILTPFVPWPLSHGGAVRLYHLIREIALEFDVYLFAFREHERLEDLKPLLDHCSLIAMVSKPRYREPHWSTLLPPQVREYDSPPMRRLVEQLCRQHRIELLQVEFTQLASYPGDILVEHDITFDLYRQVHDRERTPASWWNWWRWHRFERNALKRYRCVITMSEKDARLAAHASCRVIPNGVDLARFRPTPEPPGQRLLFVGSFRHFPNITAFRFFIEQVWPLLEDRFPEMTVTVVAGPDPHVYWQGSIPAIPRIRVRGFVADVRPLYEQSNIVVVPTLVSAGTNLKVLEAMAMERAIVATTSGSGGIEVEHGKHLWIADGAGDFAEAIARLATDPGLRRRLRAAARRQVEQRYDWSRISDMQSALFHEILPQRISLRLGVPADIARVREIQSEALRSSRWDPGLYLSHEFYVAVCDGAVAGFIVARKTAPGEREILNIAVTAEHRCQGIGQMLMRRLLASGEPGDVFLEVRESNTAARRLYERMGFENTARRHHYYDDPPETAVVMRIAAAAAQASFQSSSASERRT